MTNGSNDFFRGLVYLSGQFAGDRTAIFGTGPSTENIDLFGNHLLLKVSEN